MDEKFIKGFIKTAQEVLSTKDKRRIIFDPKISDAGTSDKSVNAEDPVRSHILTDETVSQFTRMPY